MLAFAGCGAADPPSVASSARLLTLDDALRWAVPILVDALPDRTLAGQLLMAGIENDADGTPLLALDPDARSMIAEVQPGAVVLFGGTFSGVEQVASLVGDLGRSVAIRPIVATDHEGGLVARPTSTGGVPATPIPSAAVVGAAVRALQSASPAPGAGDADAFELARELGAVMGRELRALGVTMNFAPVADVDPSDGVGAIGRHGRTFGSDPQFVGRLAAAVATGLQRERVAAVVKHFPGHGAVDEDSHDSLPVLDATLDVLRDRELAAFRAALESAPLAIMTAHLVVPAIADEGEPASLSASVTRLARDELGYDGLIVTDALNMRALSRLGSEPELVVRALVAGADLVLKPRDPVAARDAILAALETGRLSRATLVESVTRVFHAKRKLGILGPGWAGVAPAEVDAQAAAAVLGATGHLEIVRRVRSLSGGGE